MRPGRRPSGNEAAAFVLTPPSGVPRALHAELDECGGCYRAQVVLTEARARSPTRASAGFLHHPGPSRQTCLIRACRCP